MLKKCNNFHTFNRLKTKCIAFFLIFCLTFTACRDISSTIAAPEKSFEDFTNDIFKDLITKDSLSINYTLANPELYGIEDTSPSLGLVSTNSEDELRNYASSKIVDMCQYDYDSLTTDEQLLYDSLLWYFKNTLGMRDYDYYAEYLNPITGIQAELPILLSEYPFNNETDVNNYLDMLSTIDTYFESICTFEKEKSEQGLFMSKANATATIEQCKKFISDSTNNYLIEMFNTRIDELKNIAPSKAIDFKARNKTIINERVIVAYQSLIDTLTSLMDTSKNQAGLCNFDKGKSYYEKLIQTNLGTSRSLDNITTVLSNTITDNLTLMVDILKQDPSLASKLENINYNVSGTTEILNKLTTSMANDFPSLKKIDYDIKSVPSSLEDFVSPAMYIITPIDAYTNNTIYINKSLKYINTPLYTSLAHEGFPGHLYQNYYFCSKLKYPAYSAIKNKGYLEGWATYATLISYDYLDIDKTLAKLAACNNSLNICLSARADIGVHYENWSQKDIASYFEKNYFSLTNEAIESLYNKILSTPGNYVTYAMGYVEISRMKTTVQNYEKDRFSLKNFNEFILNVGPIPFDVITNRFEQQYKDALVAASQEPTPTPNTATTLEPKETTKKEPINNKPTKEVTAKP